MLSTKPWLAAAALLCVTAAAQGGDDRAAAPAAALSEDDCRAIWNTAAGRSGFLGPDGATPYIDTFASVDTNGNNQISNAEFKAGCAAGLVHKFRAPQ